jgi:hypothetical protein
MDYNKLLPSSSPVITQVSNQHLPNLNSQTLYQTPQTTHQSHSSTPQTPQTPSQSLQCTAWCKSATEQLDDIFGKSSVKSADVLVSLAIQQGLLSSSNLSVQQDSKQVEKLVHDFAQLLSCQGLLSLKLTNNGYAQREYSLFLNYINTAMLHLGEAIKRSG